MAAPFAVGDELDLFIENLSYGGGRGVARHQQFVVFVPQTAPQERVRARITLVKKNWAEAELQQVLEPSLSRRTPPCPVAGRCGGCTWQQLEYAEQVRQKQQILKQALKSFSNFKLHEFVPAPEEFRYRNRIQLHVQNSQAGYFARGSGDLVAIQDCLLAEKPLAAEIPKLNGTDFKGRVELARLPDGSIRKIEGQRPPDLHLFSQVNNEQNRQLIHFIVEHASAFRPLRGLDLYCGDGNFTLPLALAQAQCQWTGVDLSQTAIELAAARAREQNKAVEFIAQEVGKFLKRHATSEMPDLVVVDPPRIGLESTVATQLTRLTKAHLIYISCNPMTFTRDTQLILQSGSHRLTEVCGFDMFPQTDHLELVAIFAPNAAPRT